jgi:hypothetical protein
MIQYSDTQLVTNTELEYIDALSDKLRRVKKNDREYSVYILNQHDKSIFLKKILKWVESITNVKLNNYDSNLYDSYLIHYTDGDFFSKHKDIDYFTGGISGKFVPNFRKFIGGFHLYSDYTGGEFVLYNDIEKINILNKPGIVYLFDSSIEHEVLPIKTGIRKSIVFFINEEHLILDKIKSII